MCYPSPWLCSPSSLPRIPHRAFIAQVYLSLHFLIGLWVLCVPFIVAILYSVLLIPVSCVFCFLRLCCPAFLLPGVLRFLVSLVYCFFCLLFSQLLFSRSVTTPPCSIQFPCVLVLVFYMFYVLTSRFRPYSVYSPTLPLDCPPIGFLVYWPNLFLTTVLPAPNKSLSLVWFWVPPLHLPFTDRYSITLYNCISLFFALHWIPPQQEVVASVLWNAGTCTPETGDYSAVCKYLGSGTIYVHFCTPAH